LWKGIDVEGNRRKGILLEGNRCGRARLQPCRPQQIKVRALAPEGRALRVKSDTMRSVPAASHSQTQATSIAIQVFAHDQRPATNDSPQDFRAKLQNSVDTLLILPQYLVI
jgi:hypothetical protein